MGCMPHEKRNGSPEPGSTKAGSPGGRALSKPSKLEPSTAAIPPLSYRSLARWAIAVVATTPGPFAASVLVTLATTLLTQYSVQLLADIVSGLGGGPTGVDVAIKGQAIFYACVLLALIGMQFGEHVLTGWSDVWMVSRLQQKLHDKLLRLGPGFHERHELGEATAVVLQFSGGAQQILRDLVGFPVLRGVPLITAVLFLLHNLQTLQSMSVAAQVGIGLVLVALPVLGARLAGRLQAAAGASQQAQVALATEFTNSAAQPLEVQILGAERQRAAAFAVRLRTMAAARLATTIRLAMANQFQSALPTLLQACFLIYAAVVLVQSGSTAAAGSILAIYYFVPEVIRPVQDLLGFSIGVHASWPIVAQVGELLDATPPRASGEAAVPVGNAIVLDNVGLRYSDDGRAVLDGLSHAFAPGCITAIVGRSHSGKSSILSLINAIRVPTRGTISLGGVALTSIEPEVLRQYIVTVSQFPLFVTDTVRANFLLAKSDATDAEIEAVCRQTGLWPMLATLPGATPLDAMLSRTAGQVLAGGERRLFAIARALLRRPGVLLLDEPTTGIDRLAVQTLTERLPGLLAGLTVIMVEHDMNFVERVAALVCCLEDGRFTETGSPAELAAYPSLFQRLKAAQQNLSTTSNLSIESIPMPNLHGATSPSQEET